MKVLFLVKQRISYGISFGLLNSARFVVDVLNQINGFEANLVDVVDGNAVDRIVHHYKPDVVVLEALWVTPAKLRILAEKYNHIKWIVRIHSDPIFIANEGIAIDWMTQITQLHELLGNVSLSSNDREFTRYLQSILGETLYTPNLYPEVWRDTPRRKTEDGQLHIGCFGALRPMKNHLSQAIAAINFAQKCRRKTHLHFHINSDRVEQRGDEVLKNLRALFKDRISMDLVEHNWMPHHEFLHLVARMDIGMQVSLTETFNIVAADFVSQGVPILVCPDIEWAPATYKANPNSLEDIENGIKRLINIDSKIVTHRAKERLAEWNIIALEHWLKSLGRA